MPRACSKLVMLVLMLLLTLSMASPALAAGKKKKAAADKAETAEEAAPAAKPEGKSTDELMGDATKPGATKKPAAPADGEAPPADAEGVQEAPAEPDSWERPPEEAEKPKKEVAAPVEEKAGDGRPWMAGLIVGYGFKTDSDTGSLASAADPYGLTAGLRGGYSLDFNLYVGLFFAYYLGGSESGVQARVNTGTTSSSASSLQFGAEAGYDFWLGSVILRSSLQLGGQFAFTQRMDDKRTTGDFIAGPGLGLFVPIDGWFIGGEARPVLPFANAPVMVLVAGQVGLRFE